MEEFDHHAHVALYTELLQAETMAITLGQVEQLDRREMIGKVVNGRLPHLKKDFWLGDTDRILTTGKSTSFADLKGMVEREIRILTAQKALLGDDAPVPRQKPSPSRRETPAAAAPDARPETRKSRVPTDSCSVCNNDDHPTSVCEALSRMEMNMKLETIRKKFLCVHCLEKGHIGKECNNVPTCAICRKKHNTLLHGRPKLDFRKKKQEEEVDHIADPSKDSAPPMTPGFADADASTGDWADSSEAEAS